MRKNRKKKRSVSGLKCKVREWQSGKCQNSGECVYVGGGHGDLLRLKTDIYGSKEYLLIFFFFFFVFMFRFEGRGFRFTLPLAFVSQLTSTALLQGVERPRVHLLFIVKGSLMIYCSTDYKSDFMFKETVFCYRVIETVRRTK